jgi:hypothetical protein
MRIAHSPLARLVVALVAVFGLLAITTPAGASFTNVTIVPSPSPGTNYNRLEAVSCVSESWCVAVGDYSIASEELLALLWDGVAWTQMTVPAPSGASNLSWSDVSCESASWCVAVGNYYLNSTDMMLVMSWDGTSWTQASVPTLSGNNLHSVSCLSTTMCFAVGEYYSNGDATLVLQWDGAAWTQVQSPYSVNQPGVEVNSVSCISASSCMAVGSYNYQPSGGSAVHQTWAMSWDGSSWSNVASPNVGSFNNELKSVSCISASSCVAVGTARNSSFQEQTLTMTWDGTAWTTVTSPNPADTGNYLRSVSCATATSCVAVGLAMTANGDETLVLNWDGSAWTQVASPNGLYSNQLKGVSCVNSSWCIAAGDYVPDDLAITSQTMILAIGAGATPTPVDPAAPVAPAFTG